MVFDTKFSLQSFLKQVKKLTISQRISIENMGFGNVLQITYQILRRHQLIELMERWCPEKHAFILRPGEITVTLMDVVLILGLRVIGDPVVLKDAPFTELERDFGASVWCRRVTVASLKERLESLGEKNDENFLRSFLLFTFGTLLFPKSNGKVDSRYLILLRDLEKVSHFAWGAAVHSDLIYCLSQRKKKNVNCIGGCLILLQIWCYEHLKVGRLILLNISFPRSCRWEKVTSAYIRAHRDREVFPPLFRNLERSQILWELKVTSEESEIEFVKELLQREEHSSNEISIDKEDNARTNYEMVEQWVDLAAESNTDERNRKEQEDLVTQPRNAVLLEENNDSTPSTSYHMQDVQKGHKWVSHPNQEVLIICEEDTPRTNSETVEQWVDLVTESHTDASIHEELEVLVRQPQNAIVLLEETNDSIPTISNSMQELQKGQQWVTQVNQEVFIISDDDEGELDARTITSEEQIIKLKNEIETLRNACGCIKEENLELRKAYGCIKEENLGLRLELENVKEEHRLELDNVTREHTLYTDIILDRLEKVVLDEDVDIVLATGESNI